MRRSVGSSASPAATAAASAAGGDLVGNIDIGGRTLSVACLGPVDTGRPTVIFESGLGADRFVWADVFTGLMATDRGCSTIGKGLGQSQPGPKPRTTDGQVDLRPASGRRCRAPVCLRRPLVGRLECDGLRRALSAGGGRRGHGRHPTAGCKRALVAALPPRSSEFDVLGRRAGLIDFEGDPTLNPEGLDLAASAIQAKAAPIDGAPLVVLTAGGQVAITEGLPADLAATFLTRSGWTCRRASSDFRWRSTGSCRTIHHDMPFERTGVIVDAIRDVLGKAAG